MAAKQLEWANCRKPVTTSTDDALLTDFGGADNYSALSASSHLRVVNPHGAPELMFKVLGTDAEGEMVDIQIVGWGYADTPGNRCSGTVLYQGRAELGAHNPDDTSIYRVGWPSATYLEARDFDATTFVAAAGGSNPSGAVCIQNGRTAVLVVPTLGFQRITVELNIPVSVGMTTCGVIVRPVYGEREISSRDDLLRFIGEDSTVTVETAGTAVRLNTARHLVESVTITADTGNGADLRVGRFSTVVFGATPAGQPVPPGGSIVISGPLDLYDWGADVNTGGNNSKMQLTAIRRK